jgi:hypothetical protein
MVLTNKCENVTINKQGAIERAILVNIGCNIKAKPSWIYLLNRYYLASFFFERGNYENKKYFE